MASGHTGRMLTYFGSMDKGQPPNAKQKAENTTTDEPKDFTSSRAAVIEQWICFVLGIVCIACGILGVFANPIEGPPSAFVAWLESAYMPALRVTALLCLFMGLLLVRRGWSSPTASRKERKMKDDPEDIPMAYLLYVVLGILLLGAGAVIFIIRMF